MHRLLAAFVVVIIPILAGCVDRVNNDSKYLARQEDLRCPVSAKEAKEAGAVNIKKIETRGGRRIIRDKDDPYKKNVTPILAIAPESNVWETRCPVFLKKINASNSSACNKNDIIKGYEKLTLIRSDDNYKLTLFDRRGGSTTVMMHAIANPNDPTENVWLFGNGWEQAIDVYVVIVDYSAIPGLNGISEFPKFYRVELFDIKDIKCDAHRPSSETMCAVNEYADVCSVSGFTNENGRDELVSPAGNIKWRQTDVGGGHEPPLINPN